MVKSSSTGTTTGTTGSTSSTGMAGSSSSSSSSLSTGGIGGSSTGGIGGSSTGGTTGQRDFETTGSNGGRTDAAREKLSNLGGRASQQIDNAPLIAIGAGAALGAILGAVLPRSEKEKELLGPLGTKLTEATSGAADRAREMGKQKFDEMAGDKVREFFGAGSTSSSGSSNA